MRRLFASVVLSGAPFFLLPGCSSNEESAPPAATPDASTPRPKRDAGEDAAPTEPKPLNPTARCETQKPSPGAFTWPLPEAGSDASAPGELDAGDGGAIVTTPVRFPRVVHSGGPILPLPRFVPIYFEDTEDRVDIDDFMGSVGCTQYWRDIAYEYGVGEGISAPGVVLKEPAPDKISDAQIQKWLVTKIKEKALEAPTSNTLYVIFYPGYTNVTLGADRSCFGFGGYHNDAQLPDGTLVAYAVVPRCGNIEQLTSTTTHELIEGATDPYPSSNPAYQTTSDEDVAWAYIAGGEVADLCTFIEGSSITVGDYPYTLQRSWSNKASSEGRDPCVPSSRPFAYAAPSFETSIVCGDCGNLTTEGVHVPPGTSKRIIVTIGSDGASGNVGVSIVSGSALPGQWGSTAQSTFALDRNGGAIGEKLVLTITAASNASGSELFAVVGSYQGRRHYWYGLITH